MMQANEFIKQFEAYCPLWLAEEGDPVGLHIGTLDKPIERVLVTLDVRPEVVAEAIEKQSDLIIAKHPPIFRPVKRLDTDDPQTKMYADLLANNIAVYAAHTNMDIIPNGLNDWFCELLGIENTQYLTQTHTIKEKKLAAFVPTEQAAAMRETLAQAGAGVQGNYTATSYSTTGVGRFTPIADAQPTIGAVGVPEQVQETKIEVIFPETKEQQIIQTMLAAHPYEEPAYDVYSLENGGQSFGLGRVGELAQAVPLADFIKTIKQVFQLDGLRVITHEPEKLVKRIAICGGSGEKFYPDALRQNADVYITGDIYYHTGHDMLAHGLTAIDPGHYIESLCKSKLVALFDQWKQANDWQVDFIISTADTNPFTFY